MNVWENYSITIVYFNRQILNVYEIQYRTLKYYILMFWNIANEIYKTQTHVYLYLTLTENIHQDQEHYRCNICKLLKFIFLSS